MQHLGAAIVALLTATGIAAAEEPRFRLLPEADHSLPPSVQALSRAPASASVAASAGGRIVGPSGLAEEIMAKTGISLDPDQLPTSLGIARQKRATGQYYSSILRNRRGQHLRLHYNGDTFMVGDGVMPVHMPGSDAFTLRPGDGVLGAKEPPLPCGGDDPNMPASYCSLFAAGLFDRRGGQFCTGVLISPHRLLTAAHCFCDGADRWPAIVRIGSDDTAPAVRTIGDGPDYYLKEQACTGSDAREMGDLAILSLDEDDVAAAQRHYSALGPAPAGTPPSEDDKMRVQIAELDWDAISPGEAGPEGCAPALSNWVWNASTPPTTTAANASLNFAFFGFGLNEERGDGIKYAGVIRLRCTMPKSVTDPDNLKIRHAIFGGNGVGTCRGDSGGGVFKPVAARSPGYGALALVGILSGHANSSDCFSSNGVVSELLATQHDRRVVRLDSGTVRQWLAEATAEDGGISVTDALHDPVPRIVRAQPAS